MWSFPIKENTIRIVVIEILSFRQKKTLDSTLYKRIIKNKINLMEYSAVEESEVDSELITDDDDSDSSAEEVSSSDQGWIITMVKPWKFFAH